ncbi:MAG: hypothetical protein WC455_26400 [Dehalococcoidia bacterium]|jgi:CO/xanthine dehydrogenase Mo-binding subunit
MNLRTLHQQSAAITGRRPWDVMERNYEQTAEDRESRKREEREDAEAQKSGEICQVPQKGDGL